MNTLGEINSRIDDTEDQISDLEYKIIVSKQGKQQNKKIIFLN